MVYYILVDVPKWICIFIWAAGNLALFGYTFWKYHSWDEYYYLRCILGMSVAFSRAAAAALNLNLCLILLPVCRNLISRLRGICECTRRRTACRLLDKNISFHKLCAYAICFWTAIHFFAHTINFERFTLAAENPDNTTGLEYKLSTLPDEPDGTWINPAHGEGHTSPTAQALTRCAGVTGAIAIVVLVTMVSSSLEIIRRSMFEVFWFTHHLFIIFFAVLLVHGSGGIIRKTKNLEEHNLTQCENDYELWNKKDANNETQCPDPQFEGSDLETWKWVIVPLVFYFFERVIRFLRRFQTVQIIKVVRHPSNVLEIQMKKSGFSMMSGQYILLNCPTVSVLEWHPFTLTSAPADDTFSVHMRIVGDWTEAVSAACIAAEGDTTACPKISVDGPFGTCSEDVFSYDIAILVGAGIGVTPFASIIRHIWHVHSVGERTRLHKVYFYWICPDTQAFSWFVELLRNLEDQLTRSHDPQFLELNIFWTRGWTQEQRRTILGTSSDEIDVITGLRQHTQFGRPHWDQIFTSIGHRHASRKVGVFFCGPAAMASTLQDMSKQHSSVNPYRTTFVFNKENF